MHSTFYGRRVPAEAELALTVAELLCEGVGLLLQKGAKPFRVRKRDRRSPATLRPGDDTPLWNELRRQLRPHVREYGMQAKLGRVMGLPRQRINAFLTRGCEMPDAERTLQLVAWLAATRAGRQPA
jgi:hypothetical protein